MKTHTWQLPGRLGPVSWGLPGPSSPAAVGALAGTQEGEGGPVSCRLGVAQPAPWVPQVAPGACFALPAP